jgi:hypothetical protein
MAAKVKPIRVSEKDLQEERKKRKGFQYFPKGSCHLLHPDLGVLDKHNGCKLFYELEYKFFYVKYGNKELITPEVSTVKEIVGKYIYGG